VDVELRPILDDSRAVVAYVERLTTVRSASARASADGLVGGSPAFVAALSAVQRVAPAMLPVLLLGESGTGKELFARAVHEASPRAGGPFVVVDCSGLTETLFESELFGHEKGAFTGANARKPGLVETAQGGTLFLDEMGDVPLAMQVKLLRLIESGRFRRVGAVETLQADFRLIAATHQPLRLMVANGRFRQDLFYRISAFPIELPPLRERRDDIPMLVDAILQRSGGHGARRLTVAPDAMARLQRHPWPGNVRELRNVLDRARLLADDTVVRAEQLPQGLGELLPAAGPEAGAARPGQVGAASDWAGVTSTALLPWQPAPPVAPDLSTAPNAPNAPNVPNAPPARHRLVDEQRLRQLAADRWLTRKALAAQLGWSERTLYRRLQALGLA
jgi:DNA-binding NtrC family response regulator